MTFFSSNNSSFSAFDISVWATVAPLYH